MPGSALDLSPQAVVDANALEKKGNTPFHLKMSFQIFDMQGKPSDTGNLEYWWADAEGTHLNASTTDLGTIHDLRWGGSFTLAHARTLYLLSVLLSGIQSPGMVLGLPKTELVSEHKVIGSIPLECLHAAGRQAGSSSQRIPVACFDAATETIRLVEYDAFFLTRNRLARFGGTRVALDLTMSSPEKTLLTAHVDQLQSFVPTDRSIQLSKPVTQASPADSKLFVPNATLLQGQKMKGALPSYPMRARENRIEGTVLLIGLISKEGDISYLAPVASPDASLTEASMEAVKAWKYRPYLADGKPIEVSTTFTVNFALNH